MESLVRARNVESICYQIQKYKYKSKNKIVIDIVKLFCNMFVDSKNTYIAILIDNRLTTLSSDSISTDSFYKLLTEVYVFLATINHPECNPREKTKKTKSTQLTEIDSYKNRLPLLRNKMETYDCIHHLHASSSELLWKFVGVRTPESDYCKALERMYAISNQKVLLHAAYDTFYNTYIFTTSIYNNLVFQCMLKIPYLIYEDDVERNMKLHKACLRYVPSINNMEEPNRRDSKTFEKKTLELLKPKKKTIQHVFEKTSAESLPFLKHPVNNVP